jgi:hypothetical protein
MAASKYHSLKYQAGKISFAGGMPLGCSDPMAVTNSHEGGRRGRESAGARSRERAQAIMAAIYEETATLTDAHALTLKWLTDRLNARSVKSPTGSELTPTTVTRIMRRCNRTLPGLQIDVAANRLHAIRLEDQQDVEGNAVASRRENRHRRAERQWDKIDLAEEFYLVRGELEVDLLARDQKRKDMKLSRATEREISDALSPIAVRPPAFPPSDKPTDFVFLRDITTVSPRSLPPAA